ncbi:hypothetical protein K458DRAFT_402270 [Lentithecium fluviatile CBS 122367]|uniref:Uncharacterized protein n=1 Tax=Lentithecium fluviatile CBS 122367 TaxID=1168545 RepID=A0A6G1J901_9PLEO|nr:hypothetical protein K458DRAFT_402270 [Lentithecium fluviatile CBS 122367]
MDLVAQMVAGSTFGAALTASGVWNPSTIVEQMRFHDFHMLKVFMTASSASALFMHLLSRSGNVPNKPRPASLLLTGVPYDGNIIGGAMVGFGMTLTGACPGTVLVQIVTRTYPGLYTFAGGVAGGILYVALQRHLRPSGGCSKPDDESLLLWKKYHINPDLSVLAYEAMCIGVVSMATVLAPPVGTSSFLPPIVGGLCIGAAQLASLVLRGQPVGISTAYEDLGAKVCGLFKKSDKPGAKSVTTPTQAIAFAAGVMLGAAALVRLIPKFAVAEIATAVSPARAVIGGVIMVFGARLAGGCTSGHGISGMSMLATSSVVTVASMFAGGMGLAQILSCMWYLYFRGIQNSSIPYTYELRCVRVPDVFPCLPPKPRQFERSVLFGDVQFQELGTLRVTQAKGECYGLSPTSRDFQVLYTNYGVMSNIRIC